MSKGEYNTKRGQMVKREPDQTGSYVWIRVRTLPFALSKMESQWMVLSRRDITGFIF